MGFFSRQRQKKQTAVEISEKNGVRLLHLGGPAVQSAMRIRSPYLLELEYTRAMMAFLLFKEIVDDVLLIGLGGGSIAKFIHRFLSETRLTALEINPEVVAAARSYFLLPEDDARLNVVVGDGAAHIRSVHAGTDVLLVDGYDASRIVEDLASEAFYCSCLAALRPGGVAVFNLWGSDKFFDVYFDRISKVFDARLLMLPAEQKGNIQIFAFAEPAPQYPLTVLKVRAKQLDALLPLGLSRFLDRMRSFNPAAEAGFSFD